MQLAIGGSLDKTKPFIIPKQWVMDAYKAVKANAGAAGVDKQSIADFEGNLKDNLYRIWNRMSSGTYFPPAIRAVPIPKKTGGERILGVPTVGDRIAQMVVKIAFEPKVEPIFHKDSYGYRPNKSALDAVGITRERCWKYNWCLEFDIKGLFDNIDHSMLMKAIKKHTQEKWILLYTERWLKAPMQHTDGTLEERAKGTAQGSVISPVLSNLFLHYVFDSWMSRTYKNTPWCRYADDGLLHCKTEHEAKQMLIAINERFKECKLEIHPEKTKIIYCKDGGRKSNYKDTKFDFLGYSFRSRSAKNSKDGTIFMRFLPAASDKAIKAMKAKTRIQRFGKRTDLDLHDIAELYNPVLRGWINYYGRYTRTRLYPVFKHFNKILINWIRNKYKKIASKERAVEFLKRMHKKDPKLFAHWSMGKGMVNSYA